MAVWDWVAATLPDWDEIISAVMPLSVRVGGVQMEREVVALRAWEDPGGPEAVVARTYLDAAALELTLGQADQLNNGLQDQADRVTRSRGGSFGGGTYGLKVETSMVQMIIPNTYRVSIEAVSGGQSVVNVVGVNAASGNAAGAAAAVQAAWKVSAGPLGSLSSLYQLTGFRALDLSSANGGIAYLADSANGGNAQNVKSTNAASALVKWNGGTRSRSSRGRLYYGPLTEIQIASDGRTLEAAARTTINTAFANFRASLTNQGFPLCVISPTLMESFPVTSSTVESIIATQRRRIR